MRNSYLSALQRFEHKINYKVIELSIYDAIAVFFFFWCCRSLLSDILFVARFCYVAQRTLQFSINLMRNLSGISRVESNLTLTYVNIFPLSPIPMLSSQSSLLSSNRNDAATFTENFAFCQQKPEEKKSTNKFRGAQAKSIGFTELLFSADLTKI